MIHQSDPGIQKFCIAVLVNAVTYVSFSYIIKLRSLLQIQDSAMPKKIPSVSVKDKIQFLNNDLRTILNEAEGTSVRLKMIGLHHMLYQLWKSSLTESRNM